MAWLRCRVGYDPAATCAEGNRRRAVAGDHGRAAPLPVSRNAETAFRDGRGVCGRKTRRGWGDAGASGLGVGGPSPAAVLHLGLLGADAVGTLPAPASAGRSLRQRTRQVSRTALGGSTGAAPESAVDGAAGHAVGA